MSGSDTTVAQSGASGDGQPKPKRIAYPDKSEAVCPPIVSQFRSMLNPQGTHREVPHTGIDVRLPVGTPLYSAHNEGLVVASGTKSQGGNFVVIRYPTSTTGTYPAIFLQLNHLNEFAVNKGDRVNLGDIVGYSGKTGTHTSHVHITTSQPFSVKGLTYDGRGKIESIGELDLNMPANDPNYLFKVDARDPQIGKIAYQYLEDGQVKQMDASPRSGIYFPVLCEKKRKPST